METITQPQPRQLHYLPNNFKISTWNKLKPYYDELKNRTINSTDDLRQWILDWNELEAVISEEFGWRYIKISTKTNDQKAQELYQYAIAELGPNMAPYADALNRKLVASPFLEELDKEEFFIHIRGIQNEVELFREENIPLGVQISLKAKEYGEIMGAMNVEVNGKTLTLQQAGSLLEETNREKRKEVYFKINERVREAREQLEKLFSELLELRQQVAQNANYDNYRDYKFREMGRFDYTVQDCTDFHNSIASEIMPLVEELHQIRKRDLKLDDLRPWDMAVDTSGEPPLRPFTNTQELIEKSTRTLAKLHPQFGECLAIMNQMGRLDLDSRQNKRPGGYNYPLHFSGVPFIFMNATNSINDMRVLMHEGGHAVHSILTRDYPLNSAKSVPSEVAELASMTMELLTMDYWDEVLENEEELRRAKINQLEGVLKTLPWIALIDKFQHWLYTHPKHTEEERLATWRQYFAEFSSSIVNREGLEKFSNYSWHRQLHLFEVPFYYIEYGMAQLGAIAIWKRYREEPKQAVEDYIEALKLGYTKPIGDIYERAGIAFDFSQDYVRELGAFVKKELEELIFG